MMKTILKFLIALIAPSTLTVIYIFSETHIVKSLSADSTGELSRTLLRSGLGVSSALLIALSYWICDLKEKLNILVKEKKANETPTFYDVNPDALRPSSKTKKKLDGTQINILRYLAACGTHVPLYPIMSDCSLSEQVALYHLKELEDIQMIELNNVNYQKMWSIAHDGRAYLIKHKLLS